MDVMIKLTHVIDSNDWETAVFYTCSQNIASMEVIERKRPNMVDSYRLTEITTFSGDKICVSETPEDIFDLLRKEVND